MKKFFTVLTGLFGLACVVQAQTCTDTRLDWDYLDFFPSAGNGIYTNLAQSQTQHYTFGAQRVTITHNYIGSNALGENATNTAASGEDLQFKGNGTITFTFPSPVQNVKFSLYDIDASQRIQVDAKNGTTGLNVLFTKVSGTVLTISNNGTPTAMVEATSNSNVADNNTDGSVNVEIAGPVTSFTINITNTGNGGCNINGKEVKNCTEFGDFWLSDVSACANGSFPANYFEVSKPFTGQPGYVLAVRDNSFYYVNTVTGQAKFIFSDAGHTNINSVAYDPVNKFIYYVYSLTGPLNTNGAATTNENNKTLRRYDYNMDTFGVVLNNINTLGVPTFEGGVESGAAAFYNGSLYLGIEAPASSSSFESIVWKIDFNNLHQPVAAAQVYGITGAGHDWADIGVAKGILYDFDGSASAPNFYHLNMLTGMVTPITAATGLVPRQTAVDWQGTVYSVGTPSTGTTGVIAPYNYNGNLVTTQEKTITLNGVAITGSWGDAGEAFKPKADFGDAPASYDPDPMAPAMHEMSSSLRLGGTLDVEWAKTASAGASYDGNDEDGLPFVRIISSTAGIYFTDVNVYNTTGGTATVAAWVDFNNNGIFEIEEGMATTVGSAAGMQTVQLTWNNIPQNLPSNSFTYLRLRISSLANQLTVEKPSGYMADGEVEDWQVQVNVTPLSIKVLDFNARKISDTKARVTWKVEEEPGTVFSLEKSVDGNNWLTVTQVIGQNNGTGSYIFDDHDIAATKVAYRLKYMDASGKLQYSPLRTIWFGVVHNTTSIFPNPAQGNAILHIDVAKAGTAYLHLFDQAGKLMLAETVTVQKGSNNIDLKFIGRLNNGSYHVQVLFDGETYSNKLVVSR